MDIKYDAYIIVDVSCDERHPQPPQSRYEIFLIYTADIFLIFA